MEFKDIGILPEDCLIQEASRIFFDIGSQYQPATSDSSVVKP